MKSLSAFGVLVCALACCVARAFCAEEDREVSYRQALEQTAIALGNGFSVGSTEEVQAIARFTEFLREWNPETIADSVQAVYASEAYFNDTIKDMNSSKKIAHYLAKSLEATETVRIEVLDVARSGVDYYFRWVMDIKFRNLNNGDWTQSEGMSQIRFNHEGKVLLHRDFWDAAGGLFAYMPVVGSLLRWIKGRL